LSPIAWVILSGLFFLLPFPPFLLAKIIFFSSWICTFFPSIIILLFYSEHFYFWRRKNAFLIPYLAHPLIEDAQLCFSFPGFNYGTCKFFLSSKEKGERQRERRGRKVWKKRSFPIQHTHKIKFLKIENILFNPDIPHIIMMNCRIFYGLINQKFIKRFLFYILLNNLT